MSHLFYCQELSLFSINYGCHFPTEQWISDQPSQYAWQPETRKHHPALIRGWWHLILGGDTYHLCRAASQKPHSLKAFLYQQQAALKGITSFLATVDAFGLHVTFIPAPEAFTPWMKWRNKNFPVKTVCCKQLQSVPGFVWVLQGSASCECHSESTLPICQNWAVTLEHVFHEICALQAAHTLFHRGQGQHRELLLWDELISNSTPSQFSSQSIWWLLPSKHSGNLSWHVSKITCLLHSWIPKILS